MKVKSFTVTIEAPMHKSIKPLTTFKSREIQQWENTFICLRDDENVYEYKRNYERCRALLKYAHSCWGELKEISNGKNTVIFTFEFDKLEGLAAFVDDFDTAVEGETM